MSIEGIGFMAIFVVLTIGLGLFGFKQIKAERQQRLHLMKIESFQSVFGTNPGPEASALTSRGQMVQSKITAELNFRQSRFELLCEQQTQLSRRYPLHVVNHELADVTANDIQQFDRLQREIDGARAALEYARSLAEYFGYTDEAKPPFRT